MILPLLSVLLAATASAPAASDAEALVLIVASNRGSRLDRSPLQYADDDAAKYHRVFSAIAGRENALLLTDFDPDTAGLFPSLAATARPPTRANLQAAALELGARSAEARAAGRAVRFYFVFAGHGDVDEGRGFLELSDGPFTADQLQELIRTVAPTEGHVILDSCNSFFVVNPRKAGGQRFATPRDTAERLAQRLPNVGVFLSTSAQAEVFEWSELQSGVFSHAVRSGLMGAADADHDGRVSYQELAAFVETSAADIKNPLFRPKVFARGPNGEDGRPLLSLPRAPRAVLLVDEPGPIRLAARDRDGLRWVDAYKEPGDRLELWFPGSIEGELEIERLRTPGAAETAMERRYLLPAVGGERIAMGALLPASSPLAARGAGEIFRALFARPFGPQAYAAWLQAVAPRAEPTASNVVLAPTPQVALVAAPPVAPPPEPGRVTSSLSWVSLRAGVVVRNSPTGSNPAPNDEPDWKDPGADVALSLGRSFRPWLEGELAIGYHDATSHPSPYEVPGDTYVNRSLTEVVLREQVTPLEATIRLLRVTGGLRGYVLAGAGLEVVHVTFDPQDGNPTLRTTKVVPEAHVGAGARWDLRDRWFLGAEARGTLARVDFIDHQLGLEGLRVGALLGWRL